MYAVNQKYTREIETATSLLNDDAFITFHVGARYVKRYDENVKTLI